MIKLTTVNNPLRKTCRKVPGGSGAHAAVCFSALQVSGEVPGQAGRGQRAEQDDAQQHRHRPGSQPTLGQDRGVRGGEGGTTHKVT